MTVALILLTLFTPQTPVRFEELVRITVAADPHYTLEHEIVIEAEPPVLARTPDERDERVWSATRTSARGIETIRSDACLPLRTLALSFASLPAIPVNPAPSGVFGPSDLLPPTRKDGYSTTLSFVTRTDDGSWARVEIDGGNAYARWGHDAVAALNDCWAPLTP